MTLRYLAVDVTYLNQVVSSRSFDIFLELKKDIKTLDRNCYLELKKQTVRREGRMILKIVCV